jgi:drug/metabolite transporter (DMT)-like permease
MQNTSNLTKIGAGALAATGVLHLVLAPEYMGEKAYLGVLFIAGGITAIGLALALVRRDEPRVWIAGAVVAAAMAIGFVLSRTTGLPGFHEGEWELSGLLSLGLEAVVVLAAARALRGGAPALAQAR